MSVTAIDPRTDQSLELFVTLTGGRLHVRGCPHPNSALSAATPEQRATFAICSWCRKEIDGVGRTFYGVLDDALRAHGCHVNSLPLIRGALREVEYDQIWSPHSDSYVALGRENRAVAWVGMGYVDVKGGAYTTLPGYRPGAGGGRPVEQVVGDTCPTCFMQMPVTNLCDFC